MPETRKKKISDVWKTVALALLTFVIGAGSSTLYGTAALSEHVAEEKEAQEEYKETMRDLHFMQAEVHSRLMELIERNEKVLNDLRVGLAEVAAKLELILDREFERHHSDADDNTH